jgi:uncharacterized membrane protein YccF (DUF307 family)
MPARVGEAAVMEPGPHYAPQEGPGYAAQAIHFNPIINVAAAAPLVAPHSTPIVVAARQEVPLVLRAIWFLCVGLWLGLLWLIVAWALNVSLLGLPLGLAMINRVPQVMTLRSSTRRYVMVTPPGGAPYLAMAGAPQQVPFALRAIYFLVIGIWLSLLWMLVAWAAAALLITLPLSFWMFDRLPAVTTLRLT